MLFDDLIIDYVEWSSKTFPESTMYSSLIHARKEIYEIESALHEIEKRIFIERKVTSFDDVRYEYVDALMCIIDSANRAGIRPLELMDAFQDKLEINKARTWIKNNDGTYSHK